MNDEAVYETAQRALDFYGPVPGTNVAYDDALADSNGAHFWLFREPETTDDELRRAMRRLREDRDVVGPIRIIDLKRALLRKAK